MISTASSKVGDGRIPGSRRASIVFPAPGPAARERPRSSGWGHLRSPAIVYELDQQMDARHPEYLQTVDE